MPIDLFGTFLDRLSTAVEGPDKGGSTSGSGAESVIGEGATGIGPASQPPQRSSERSPIDAVYDKLTSSKRDGMDYVDLASLLPLVNNSMSTLLSSLRQLEEYGMIQRKDRNLIGLKEK